MKRIKTKTLRVLAETIRALSTTDLAGVNGGISAGFTRCYSCPPSCTSSCPSLCDNC